MLAAACMSNAQATQDCLAFTESLQLSPVLTMDYVVNLDDSQDTSDFPQGVLSAKITFQGIGWVSVGFTTGAAAMVPSEAIIGLPDESQGINNPGKYTMSSKSVQGVQLLPESQQTLVNATITQTDSTTTMTFQKILVEADEIPINGNGQTTFLWAQGYSNTLAIHQSRGAVGLSLSPCNAVGDSSANSSSGSGGAQVIETPTYRSLWTAHGVFAGVAWGVLVPLAISSALLRDMIPKQYWFKLHMFLNSMAAVFTLVAFSLAVTAQQKGTPKGTSPNHFAGLAHNTVGLVITIFVTFQVVGGYMRPHLPHKAASDEEAGSTISEKTKLRTAWEILHKFFGVGLLATAFWQVQSGLSLYASQFGTTDLSVIFWIVVVSIGCATLALFGYGRCTKSKNDPEDGRAENRGDKNPDPLDGTQQLSETLH